MVPLQTILHDLFLALSTLVFFCPSHYRNLEDEDSLSDHVAPSLPNLPILSEKPAASPGGDNLLPNHYGTVARKPDSKLNLELDLDYLEQRHSHGRGVPHIEGNDGDGVDTASTSETSPESVDLIKVVLLGAPNVGKTSIIQEVASCHYARKTQNWLSDQNIPFVQRNDNPSNLPQARPIEDFWALLSPKVYGGGWESQNLPVIPYFPVNSYYEWTSFRYYDLRSATAYILVFDLSNIETFQYIQTLRDQIFESRDMCNVPLLVVGNKRDLIIPPDSEDMVLSGTTEEKRSNIVNLVKKHWRCGYVECSAKFNCNIVAVFKELMNMIDQIVVNEQSPVIDNIQDVFDGNKCFIL